LGHPLPIGNQKFREKLPPPAFKSRVEWSERAAPHIQPVMQKLSISPAAPLNHFSS
jgi:hypothetical protein